MLLRPDKSALTQRCVWTPKQHCLELDGVRGLAILLVTVYRILKELPATDNVVVNGLKTASLMGEKGVDLFFVLSGFLITSILLETREKPRYFRNFMARRALRIFPLYFVALALFLWLVPMMTGLTTFDGARANQLYLWTYMSNVYMSWTNSWCFGPLDHFWSLAVEEHFYLVWPAIVFVLPARWLTRFCIGTIVIVGVLRSVAATRPEWNIAVSVLTLFRCDALCFGSLLAGWMYRWQNQDVEFRAFGSAHVRRWLVTSLGVLAVVLLAIGLTGKRWFTIPSTLFPLFWMIGMWWVLTGDRLNRVATMMRHTSLRWLGRYSYGMYVFQLPLLTMLPFAFVAPSSGTLQWPLFLAYFAGMFVAISGLAWISFHAMEKHFLKCRKWFA
jgi:peptidoglycan/LPS O-acetylase OafA/YrhL